MTVTSPTIARRKHFLKKKSDCLCFSFKPSSNSSFYVFQFPLFFFLYYYFSLLCHLLFLLSPHSPSLVHFSLLPHPLLQSYILSYFPSSSLPHATRTSLLLFPSHEYTRKTRQQHEGKEGPKKYLQLKEGKRGWRSKRESGAESLRLKGKKQCCAVLWRW